MYTSGDRKIAQSRLAKKMDSYRAFLMFGHLMVAVLYLGLLIAGVSFFVYATWGCSDEMSSDACIAALAGTHPPYAVTLRVYDWTFVVVGFAYGVFLLATVTFSDSGGSSQGGGEQRLGVLVVTYLILLNTVASSVLFFRMAVDLALALSILGGTASLYLSLAEFYSTRNKGKKNAG